MYTGSSSSKGHSEAAARDSSAAAVEAATHKTIDITSNRAILPRSASGFGEVREWWKEQSGYSSANDSDG